MSTARPTPAVPAATGATASVSDPDPRDPAVPGLVRRLRRVEGQVRGLIGMIESGRDCADVVTQLAAASRALDRVGFLLVTAELRKCTTGQDPARNDPETIAKAAAVEKLFLRLA